jgi:hypothetical protein
MRLHRLAALAAAFLFALAPATALAAGVTADVQGRMAGTYTGTNDLGSVTFAFSPSALIQFAPGTASGNADKMFSDQRTISASSSENLDLAGVLADPLGATLTFGHVKAIYVHAAAANTNDVCVGGAGSNTFTGPFADATDIVCVKPGGFLLLGVASGAGWAVTASTGDLLKVANSSSGTAVTYDVVIVGTST